MPQELLVAIAEGLYDGEGEDLRPLFACTRDVLRLQTVCRAVGEAAAEAERRHAAALGRTVGGVQLGGMIAYSSPLRVSDATARFHLPREAVAGHENGWPRCWILQGKALALAERLWPQQ